MPIYAAIVGATAGICLGFGILFLFVALRRKNLKLLNFSFALFAFGYAGTLFLGIAYHQATTLEDYLTLGRWDSLFVTMAFVGLLWYVATYTQVAPRWFLWGLSAVFILTGLINAFRPNMLFGEIIGLTSISLPWGEQLTNLAYTDSMWSTLYTAAQFALLIFIIVAGVGQYRREQRQEALILLAGMGLFILTLGYEILGESGVVDYLPVAEIGFVGIAIAVSLARANAVIRTEEELEAYKTNLEGLVLQRTAELEQAQQQLVSQAEKSATEVERDRIGRDLHDAVTQTLYSASLIAEALPRVWERSPEQGQRNLIKLRQLVRGALAEMRTLLFELRPGTLELASCDVLLRQMADSFTGRTQIPVQLQMSGNCDLSIEVKTNVYRIAQEAFNNIIKHASADRVTLVVTQSPGEFLLTMRDNGRGFDPANTPPERMGLRIMQERADAIHAHLHIESEPGEGTQLSLLWLPNEMAQIEEETEWTTIEPSAS